MRSTYVSRTRLTAISISIACLWIALLFAKPFQVGSNAQGGMQSVVFRQGENGYTDPTNIDYFNGTDYFPSARWMAKLNFLYQLPWGINFSGFANAREGYATTEWVSAETPERGVMGWGWLTPILVEEYGGSRLPNFYNVDLGLSKDFLFGRYGRLTVQVDAFNIFNFNHAMHRMSALHNPRYGQIGSILNPRVIRLGVRYRF